MAKYITLDNLAVVWTNIKKKIPGKKQYNGTTLQGEKFNNATDASGLNSHAEGDGTSATASASHAEGYYSVASGNLSHAEGAFTTAAGEGSHSEGGGTIANGMHQHVQGKFNVADNANTYAHIVGGGADINNKANIHTLDWQGNAVYSGKVTANGVATDDNDLMSKGAVNTTITQRAQIYRGTEAPTLPDASLWIDGNEVNSSTDPTTIINEHKADSAIHVSAGDRTKWDGKADKYSFSATITTTWTGTAAPYTQTISVPGILATMNPTISPVLSADTAANALILTALGKITSNGKIETVADGITVTVWGEKPATAIPITIVGGG